MFQDSEFAISVKELRQKSRALLLLAFIAQWFAVAEILMCDRRGVAKHSVRAVHPFAGNHFYLAVPEQVRTAYLPTGPRPYFKCLSLQVSDIIYTVTKNCPYNCRWRNKRGNLFSTLLARWERGSVPKMLLSVTPGVEQVLKRARFNP